MIVIYLHCGLSPANGAEPALSLDDDLYFGRLDAVSAPQVVPPGAAIAGDGLLTLGIVAGPAVERPAIRAPLIAAERF
ncbi:MAG TPA: hypothetical protein VFW71_11720 [Actinomycetota bacterium]|nr:hypothetical protein [Actinomycetota bacterium]